MKINNSFLFTNIHLIVLVIFISLQLINSLKQSDAGLNDWHLKNIGSIQSLKFLSNQQIFFYSQLGIFGHLQKSTGKILKRLSTNQNNNQQRVITINNINQKHSEVVVVTTHNQILIYRTDTLQKYVENRFMSQISTFGKVQAYWKRQNGLTYIAGDKQIRMYPDGSLGFQIVSNLNQQAQRPLKIIEIKNQNEDSSSSEAKNIILVYADDLNKKICIKEITGKTLLEKSSLNKCFDVNFCQQKLTGAQIIESSYLCISTQSQKNIKCFDIHHKGSLKTPIIKNVLSAGNIEIQEGSKSQHQSIRHLKFLKHSKNPSLSLNSQLDMKIRENNGNSQFGIAIFRNQYRLNEISNLINHSKIKNFWISFKSQIDYDIVIQFENLTLSCYHPSQDQKRELKEIWSREESLAYIDKILFMKTQTENTLDNSYHRKMLTQEHRNLPLIQKILHAPLQFLNRVKIQLNDIKGALIGQLIALQQWISGAFSIDIKDLRSIMKFKMSEQQQRRYGMRKNIIVFTKKNTILSIDSKTSEILWKRSINQEINLNNNQQLIALIKMKKDYQVQAAIAIFYVQNQLESTAVVSQVILTGEIKVLKRFTLRNKNLPTIHKLNDYSFLIKDGKYIQKFVINEQFNSEAHVLEKQYYFYSITQNKEIQGYLQYKNQVVPIWNIKLSPNETLITSKTSFRADHSRIPLVDQQKVIFKNIDSTNIAIVTRIEGTNTLNIYAINGRTGHVQFNQQKTGVSFDKNHPINLAYDQNNILVTYFSLRNRLFQIWTIEQYQDRIQTSALSILKEYFSNFEDKAFSGTYNRNQIIFLSQTYGSIVPIKNMFISESKLSLIRRNMIIITPTDQCYMIPRELISARRPKQTAIFQNEKYPPYDYLLPYNPSNFFTHKNQLIELNKMRFSSTQMQSTIFIMAHGIDAFLIRIAPDKTFDMITQDFNYIVLIAIVIVVTTIVYFLRNKMKFAKLTKNHRD